MAITDMVIAEEIKNKDKEKTEGPSQGKKSRQSALQERDILKF